MIPLFKSDLSRHAEHVAAQIRSGWVGPGRVTEEFENEFAAWVVAKHAIATTSGTTALLLSLLALDLPAGATVLAPAYGMCAGANVARLLGYKVRLVDVCVNFGTAWAYTDEELKDISAAIFIDHNGCCATTKLFVSNMTANGIPVIEDACQALGIPGAGTAGKLGCFSFSPQKLISTGQGGMVVTSDDRLAVRLRQIIDHGGDWRQGRVFHRPGGNFRFNDVLARLGAEQLRIRHELIGRRIAVRNLYRRHLPQIAPADGWMVMLPSRDGNGLVDWLRTHGIEAGRLYPPVHWGPLYSDQGPFPGAEAFHARQVYLPSWGGLTSDQIDEICMRVQTFEEHAAC